MSDRITPDSLRSQFCALRYRRKLERLGKGVEVYSAPDEECPKPMTWSEYFETPERTGEGRR